MSRLNVHLYRDSFNTPWGFRLQGGKDLNQPLTVQRVFSNSPAEGELQRGDNIIAINSRDTCDLTHKQAQDYIKHCGGQIQLIVHRPPPGTVVSPLSPPIVTPRPRAPSLQSPSHYNSSQQYSPTQYNNWRPNYNDMNGGDPYHGYKPHGGQSNTSKPTYLQIQVNQPHNQQRQPPPTSPKPKKPVNMHQQYYLQQLQQKQDRQNSGRYRSSFSQPPVTPSTPTPPWACQQPNPKPVAKLSQIGGGGSQNFGTDFKSLPRSFSAKTGPASHIPRRSADESLYNQDDLEREPEIQLATGPIPRVCSRRGMGGGGAKFGTSYGDSATLPRRQERRSSQPPSLPSRVSASPRYGGGQTFGTDYGAPRSQAPAPRVQTTLDNITLSPRTPDATKHNVQPQLFQYNQPQHAPAPAYQPCRQQPAPAQTYQPYNAYQHPQTIQLSPQYQPQQPQQNVYTPTSLLLEEQQRQKQQQLQQYQQDDAHHPMSPNKPTTPKPAVFSPTVTNYTTFSPGGQPNKQSNAVWRPAPSPGQQAPALTHSAPPPWKRPDDDLDGTKPAWRSTLKSSSGVKPWEMDIEYQQQQQEDAASNMPRSVSGEGGQEGPKVVHLQYNSPMHLYSQQNVADTYNSHAQVASPSGDAPKPGANSTDRDWSQSAVLQFLNQDKKRGGKSPSVTAKPTQHQPQHNVYQSQATLHTQRPAHHQMPQHYFDDAVGCSDF